MISETNAVRDEPVRILLVEDEEEGFLILRDLMAEIEEFRCRLDWVRTADDGIRDLRRETFDLCMFDHVPPAADGLEFICQAVAEGSRTPLVLLSGHGSEHLAVAAMKAGASDYLAKRSLSPKTLRSAILEALQKETLRRRIQERNTELDTLTARDDLTALLTRRAFLERLEEEMRRSVRYERPMSLALIDLDGFRRLNDAHGRVTGDLVLVEIAVLIKDNLRNTDYAGRYGGEEFSVLFGETRPEEARYVSDRLRERVREKVFVRPDGSRFRLTCSIGVAPLVSSVREPTTLVDRADVALYAAQSEGGNSVVVASG